MQNTKSNGTKAEQIERVVQHLKRKLVDREDAKPFQFRGRRINHILRRLIDGRP